MAVSVNFISNDDIHDDFHLQTGDVHYFVAPVWLVKGALGFLGRIGLQLWLDFSCTSLVGMICKAGILRRRHRPGHPREDNPRHTSDARAISWIYSYAKLNDTPTSSRRSSRGCRRGVGVGVLECQLNYAWMCTCATSAARERWSFTSSRQTGASIRPATSGRPASRRSFRRPT